MFIVTAKVEAWEEDFPGSRVKWVVGQSREVHDSLVDKFRNNPAAWTVSGGSDSSPMQVTKTVTGGIEYSTNGNTVKTISVRRTPLRVATFGDSTATMAAGNTDLQYFDAPFPASGATVIGPDIAKFCLNHYYPQAYLVGCGGIGGETTTQMLARDTAGASATRRAIADVLNLAPDVVILRGGSINNLATITPGTYDATIATCFAEHVKIINRLLAGGVVVIDEGIYGYSSEAVLYPALARSALLVVDKMIADYAADQKRYDLVYINSGLRDQSTGYYYSGMSYDGVHLSFTGQIRVAKLEAAALARIFGESGGCRFNGQNLISNALFAATSSVGYGTVPTGYSVVATNGAAANAKIEVIDGKPWMTVEITPSAAACSSDIYIPFNASTFGIVANDILGFELDIMVQSMTGNMPPAPTDFFVRNDLYKTAAGRVIATEFTTSLAELDGPIRAHSSIRYRCQEASAALTASSNAYFRYRTDGMTPYKIGISSPRLVKN